MSGLLRSCLFIALRISKITRGSGVALYLAENGMWQVAHDSIL